ncbi:hypothetical protein [Gloeobacter kilaueensis]|uniref:Uncharacterized protein n=1 Tax=Gloeobacter kilaueensis (strain ATCC BAA-2537 / CCAP 1431/1 / ULC 316 / JS1) TaxID=1183438 RepID=U5QGD9_GLOK1|nr:hypothetical protein [Gloeobacter kilaueensis]AGY57986.1 hypothetical protein GKIL_1740 [Gloeobacter kilaueensis JS1]
MKTLTSQKCPTCDYHRLLVREGPDLVIVLPEPGDPRLESAIVALPGDYQEAEQEAWSIIAARPDLALLLPRR